jgi:hypothetical protein
MDDLPIASRACAFPNATELDADVKEQLYEDWKEAKRKEISGGTMLVYSVALLAAAAGLGYAAAGFFDSQPAIIASAVSAGATGILGLVVGVAGLNVKGEAKRLKETNFLEREMADTLVKNPELTQTLARQLTGDSEDERAIMQWAKRLGQSHNNEQNRSR